MTVKNYNNLKQACTDMTLIRNENRDLITRACTEPEAFARLYMNYYQHVFHYCVHRLFNQHHAEDVTSVVFIKVLHNLDSFKGDEIDFRGWLFRIATNSVNDYLRAAKRHNTVMQVVARDHQAGSDIDPICDESLLKKKERLCRALLSLKPKYQTVITLHFFEKMKLVEIAACLEKKPSTIRTWLSRATAQLRMKLDISEGK